MNKIVALFFIISILVSSVSAQDQCTTINAGGNTYDFSALKSRSLNINKGVQTTFYMQFCGTASTCTTSSSVCEKDPTSWYSITQPATSCSQVVANSDGSITCTMPANGDNKYCDNNRQAIINFSCGDGDWRITSIDARTNCVYVFNVVAPPMCAQPPPIPDDQGSKGLSGGSIFLIIFFVGFATYFILGAAYNKFQKQATGLDIIPQKEFWFDLPRLVRDGCLFFAAYVKSCFNHGEGETSRLV